VGGNTGSAIVRSLADNGRLLVFGTLSGEPLSFSPRELMTHAATVEGFWLGNYMSRLRLLGKLRLIRTISNLMLEGVLVSEVGETFSLEQFEAAVQSAEKPARGGKTLFKMADN
jgi:NADPH:quinone reductase-like Zn-dependent oxidoreductase